MRSQRFTTTALARPGGGLFVAVPFDPDEVWSPKPVHHVTGTLAGHPVRAVIDTVDGVRGFVLGPAWMRGRPAPPAGTEVEVEVELAPEGPQRAELAADLAAALDADPAAGAFFDSLAQFYRKAYLRWIDGTTRRPEERARRIAEVVALLRSGVKQRPSPPRA